MQIAQTTQTLGDNILRHALFLVLIVATVPALAASKPKKPAGKPPRITQPVLFGTPESDAILAKLQIYPPDNAWHADISR
jgi:hypothetical protein